MLTTLFKTFAWFYAIIGTLALGALAGTDQPWLVHYVVLPVAPLTLIVLLLWPRVLRPALLGTTHDET